MLDSSAARISAVVLAVFIAVLVFLAPRSVQSSQYSDLTPQQARLELGRAYVESSGSPMVGIKILQQVLKDDPDNNYARWYLGSQAINTGQFRKAIHHLSILSEKLNGEEKANALNALGYAYESAGVMDSALLCYQKVFEISKDSLLLQSLKKRINVFTNQ
jgi:tetratricopeptide (TPR) repeat protein